MGWGAARALVRDVNLANHNSVLGTVTRPHPNDTPIEDVRVLWLTFDDDSVPTRLALSQAVGRRLAAISLDAVPALPRKTLIEAPARADSQTVVRWRVEAVETVRDDHYRVVVFEDEQQ